MIEGVDASNYQGSPDWPTLAERYTFAMLKASEGVGFRDASFDGNWAAVAGAGMVRGAYHFGRPDLGNTPEAEAAWFLEVVGDPTGSLLVLNLEVAGPGYGYWGSAFERALAAALQVPYRPLFCSFRSWFQQDPVPQDLGGESYLWMEWPDSNGPLPDQPPWDRCVIQQYGQARTAGVSGQIDLNRFFGDLAQLQALTVGGSMIDPGKFNDLYHQLMENDPANPTLKDKLERTFNQAAQDDLDIAAAKAELDQLLAMPGHDPGLLAQLQALAHHLGVGTP